MFNFGNIPDKTQMLINAYKSINDEGRNNLDMIIQKLREFNRSPEKSFNIEDLLFVHGNVSTCDDILTIKKKDKCMKTNMELDQEIKKTKS